MLTRPRLFGAALFALPLSAIACSSAPATPGETTESTGSTSDALTWNDAVSRAEEWVAVKLQYCQSPNGQRDYDSACSTYCHRYSDPAWDPYRSDCSGLVSWAWGLPAPGRVTSEFAPFQNDITHSIQASDLRAGDAVNNSDHIMLFKAWVTPGSRATFIEEPGCSVSQPYAREWSSDVSISGTSIHVAYNGMSFTAIRYGALTPPNNLPKGHLDGASCTAGLTGWAQDVDAPSAPLQVSLLFDAPMGKTGSGTIDVVANDHRDDLCKAIGSCNHAFTVPVPTGLADGQAHQVYAYATDDSGKGTAELAAAPKSFTCAPPKIPLAPADGVKRHVVDATSLAAWKIDRLLDIAHEPAADVDAYAKGEDMPAKPLAVIADDGSPEVWVVDGNVRRHVVSAASLSAWQLSVAKWPAAKVNAIARGIDWPKTPFVFQPQGGSAVYVLDAVEPHASPTIVGGAPLPVGVSGDDPSGAGAGEGGDPSQAAGCSASPRAPASSDALLAALGGALVLLGARRRLRRE